MLMEIYSLVSRIRIHSGSLLTQFGGFWTQVYSRVVLHVPISILKIFFPPPALYFLTAHP